MLAVDPHEVCRGAGKTSKGNTGIVLAFGAGAVLALVQNVTRLGVVF